MVSKNLIAHLFYVDKSILLKTLFMQRFYFLTFLLFLSTAVFAHSGSLQGTVRESIFDKPVEGVKVTILDMAEPMETITDANGNFSFSEVPAQIITVWFEKEGFISKTVSVSVADEATTTLSVRFTPDIINMPEVIIAADRPTSAASSMLLQKIDFELRPKNSALDMLRFVPGLFIAQHAGGGKAEQIFVRGFDMDHGTDVAAFTDGIPVNMPSHGHGQGYADLHYLIPETVENIEVYKGPYFAQFGDFSTGAAV